MSRIEQIANLNSVVHFPNDLDHVRLVAAQQGDGVDDARREEVQEDAKEPIHHLVFLEREVVWWP